MGKKSGPAAPPAPDYASAAKETAAGNLEAAKYQTEANRINQVNPYGSLTYSQDADGKWTQTETYDPRAMKALESQLGVKQGLSDQANSMIGTVRDTYNKPFEAASWDSYRQGVGGVDTSRVGTAGDFSSNASVQGNVDMSGVNGVDQSGTQGLRNFRSSARVDTNPNAYLSTAQPLNQTFGRTAANGSEVNVNAPQFSSGRQDEYSKAAYEAQMGLLRGDMDAQEQRTNNSLALQGLGPGSEASNNALASYYDGRSRQLNSLANQSVLTGNQMNNADYQSQLAGFNAGNSAVGQRFNQDITGYNTNLNAGQAENAARGQQFAQALQAFQSKNDANAQKFGQDQSAFTTNMQNVSLNNQLQQSRNQAQQQAFDQSLSQGTFNNSASAQQFGMDQAAYDNQLRALTTNAGLQQAYNQAQNQNYNQALQNYGTDWQQAQTLRSMPLNELNALLQGQQVQNPEFENFATQGYAPGVDALGAAQLQGQYNSGIYSADKASSSASNGMFGSLLGSLGGAAISKYSDERLKKNVEKIGETPGGSNVYTWDWNKKAEGIVDPNQPTVGVIAQEHPHATKKGPKGFLMVDYRKVA